MEKFRLIPMVDFVLESSQKLRHNDDCEFAYVVRKYANFLKQPLTLGMFVPCDEDGNVLEEPKSVKVGCANIIHKTLNEKYQQAKERCIFNNNSLSLYQVNRIMRNCKNIETLITYYYERTGNYLETSIRI